MRGVVLVASAIASLAFVPPGFKPVAREIRVEITQSGQMYDLINTTDCIAWPSPQVRAAGGQSGWGTFRPKNGDRGEAIGWAKHCFSDVRVVFVSLPPYYVPMGESGLQFLSGKLEDLPEIKK